MFLPPTIDLGHSEKYILSIRISADKFMFSIADSQDRKCYCLRETELPAGMSLLENIKRIVFDFNFLTQQYLQTNVIFVSVGYDLIPNEYFIRNQREYIYEFVHSDNAGFVLFNENHKQENTTVFGIDKEIFEFFSRNLYNPRFFHHSSLLMTYFEEQTPDTVTGMFAYLHDDMLDILCYSEAKLTHSLSYKETIPSNQGYYILKIWESTGLDQLSDMLYIAGGIDEELVLMLQKYIRNINKIGAFSDVYLWHEDAQKAPLDLLALSL